MSIETILNTCRVHMCMRMHTHMHALTHTGTCTHEHTDYTKLNLHNLKRAANRDSRQMKTAEWNGKCGRSIVFWGKKNFWLQKLQKHDRSMQKQHGCRSMTDCSGTECTIFSKHLNPWQRPLLLNFRGSSCIFMYFHRQTSFITNWSMWVRVCLCLSSVLLQSSLCSHFVQ